MSGGMNIIYINVSKCVDMFRNYSSGDVLWRKEYSTIYMSPEVYISLESVVLISLEELRYLRDVTHSEHERASGVLRQ
jgi:hypothetical protein